MGVENLQVSTGTNHLRSYQLSTRMCAYEVTKLSSDLAVGLTMIDAVRYRRGTNTMDASYHGYSLVRVSMIILVTRCA